MSSFAGRMREYPHISLDRFDHENLHARAYFLSHCHKDHMRGMKSPKMKRRLQSSRRVKLYCSLVTKELLLSSRRHLFWEEFISSPSGMTRTLQARQVPLELESPTQISLVDETSGESEELTVTLLPAGHCPGSVMFLFEGGCGNALYTGDFRLASGDAARMEHLHSGGRVKDIRSVYVDSTFFDPRFYQIPSREACVSAILRLVGDWIARSARHVVWLNCKAAYGYEYLFTRLGEEFNTRVHVNNLLMFRRMPEILSYVTGEHRTQIHACRHPKVTTPRRKDDVRLTGRLCLCAERGESPWRPAAVRPRVSGRRRPARAQHQAVHHVVRRAHAQNRRRRQIKDFLSYLRPVQVFPNVVPIGRTLSEVTRMLRTVCRKPPQENFTYRPLGVLKRSAATTTPHDWDSDNDLFDASAAAPLRKKPTPSRGVPNEPGPYAVAPPAPTEDSLQPDPRDDNDKNDRTELKYNYVDCTESNDDSEDDEGSEEDEESGTKTSTQTGSASVELPKWEDFFTVEPLPDSQNSQSQPCSAPSPAPTRLAGSQTPEAFSEPEDDADDSFVLSLSASDCSSQNRDADGEDRGAGDAPSEPPPGSRVSSDYEKGAAVQEVGQRGGRFLS
ncbi:protein artemis isoform X3 [Phyllopteryx taeniolatus]|uniref:protein artemis isoform X3 n=1 Tax=Phyllopteryx taeniolatus TaxID=161469 RepID=UPI002AD4B331|nr:protein artemis isoform X3 [Phyllopteryx taeniolatus]